MKGCLCHLESGSLPTHFSAVQRSAGSSLSCILCLGRIDDSVSLIFGAERILWMVIKGTSETPDPNRPVQACFSLRRNLKNLIMPLLELVFVLIVPKDSNIAFIRLLYIC